MSSPEVLTTTPPLKPSRQSWILAGAAAAVVFVAFEAFADFVAVPLREVSSVLAHAILSAVGFPVTRAGTILSTPRAMFDVVPACSGSTTLQVMLFLAILWCGIHPRLTMGRRILAILVAIPLAVAANGLRVSALVAVGHAQGGEPGDVIHAGTGLVFFALAMLGCYGLTRKLAGMSPSTGNPSDRALAWALGGVLLFLSLPFITWCLENWGGGSLDRLGFLFLVPAVGLAVWKWRTAPPDASWERAGTVALGASLVGLVAAMLVDINILRGLSLVGAFLGLCLGFKGPRFAASMLPVVLLAYLGFPSVSYQMGVLLSWKITSLGAFLGVKAAIAAVLIALMLALPYRAAASPGIPATRRWLPVQLLMAALLAAIQTYFFIAAGMGAQESRLEMSYLQGPWLGTDGEAPLGEREYFGAGRIWFRNFRKVGAAVDVLVTSTGGDRHRAHPPAYCLTGAGWETISSETTDRRLGDGSRVPLTLLRLRKEGREMLFCYWFSDGSGSYSDFSGMLMHDTLRRLGGKRADWFVFRVMTASGSAALDDFLGSFRTSLNPAVPRPPAP